MYIRIQILLPTVLQIFECLKWLFADVAFELHFELGADPALFWVVQGLP
jgi:hypothetical protein